MVGELDNWEESFVETADGASDGVGKLIVKCV
jgi:hypothetical protein